MKRLLLLVLLAVGCFAVEAQQRADAEHTARIKASIAQAAKSIETLRCDFEQQKELSIMQSVMKASGTMSYSRPDKLCWQYKEPYKYRFVLNGNKVAVGNENSTNVMDTRSNKMFGQISRLIVGSVSGEGIFESGDFDFVFLVSGTSVDVVMTPRSKQLRQMFRTVTMTFSTEDYMAEQVVMEEQGGDRTVIRFKNRKKNGTLDPKLFVVD